ncbi:MAG: cupin-like domain-containing protein [Flavobacteriaceae bacterium]|nr:cupin-like domain-containing protein [Flavobacteriaceae bacterium]
MGFEFTEIQRLKSIDKQTFISKYYKPQIPVVIEKFTADWPAYEKWNFEYINSIAGDKVVPLYDNTPVKADDGFNEPKVQMKLSEYIHLLNSEPTDLRIFLYNLLKEVPELQQDYYIPDLGLKIMKGLPMLFFGGTNSNVFMHYDIDLANIFHFHFQGKKECILVNPNQTKWMYKIPNSVICREDIDFDQPDFDKFPALKKLQPMRAFLHHGDMLYMPEGYWHYMKYKSPGFSMSLRSIAKNPRHLAQAVYNVFFMRHYDEWMRKQKGQKWIDFKNKRAVEKTHQFLS